MPHQRKIRRYVDISLENPLLPNLVFHISNEEESQPKLFVGRVPVFNHVMSLSSVRNRDRNFDCVFPIYSVPKFVILAPEFKKT